MILNYEQIKAVTGGAERIELIDGEYRFFRFNEGESEFYSSSQFYSKTFATAGVEMNFSTDARSISLKGRARVGVSYRTWYTLEIFSNGERVGAIANFDGEMTEEKLFSPFDLGELCGTFKLGEGEKRIRIVFPQFVALSISEIMLSGATFINPTRAQKKMFFYGDSISQGYDSRYPSNAYTSLTAGMLGVEGYNKAIGGEVFQPGLSFVKSEIDPEYICVAYGTNDCSTEKETFLKNSRAFYENLSKNYPNARIFALSPIWRLGTEKECKVGSFFDIEPQIKAVAESLSNVIFISGFDLVPHDVKYFYDGHLHPSDEGFKVYAKNLVEKISKYI